MADYPALVDALLRPQAYPEEVAEVELVETHISYIFLTGKHAYKVKKPVDYGFLDFTTLEKRHHYCQQEVELNRRISPEVYLGVSEVRVYQGQYLVDGPGRVVEYAVKMRQMPRERAMDALLQQDNVSEEDIRRLAVKIARFHAVAATSPPFDSAQGERVEPLGGVDRVRQNIEENFSQTQQFIGVCLSQDTFDDLVAYSNAFLAAKESLFLQRAAESRIRDCHGDLHTAQVFLETRPEPFGKLRAGSEQGRRAQDKPREQNGISIIDCIEFNHRFRYSDVAEDIAFLAMDLDFHGRPELTRLFVAAYIEASGDPGVLELLDFFKAYRAYVRGKVTALRLDIPPTPVSQRAPSISPLTKGGLKGGLTEAREQTLAMSQAYFRLAHSYTRVFPQPVLVLVAGLTGTGKSTVAQELARRWNLVYISSDTTRKELAGIGPGEHRYDAFGEGIYSSEFSRRTYDAMLEQAEQQLQMGQSVVLDATFRRGEERAKAVALARRLAVDGWLVECSLPEEEARRRLELRLQKGDSVSDGRWELFRQQQQEWEPVAEVPANRYIHLDTSGSPRETVQRVLYELYLNLFQDNVVYQTRFT